MDFSPKLGGRGAKVSIDVSPKVRGRGAKTLH